MEIAQNEIKVIKQLNHREDLTLLIDKQETKDLRKRFPEYDSFFVKVQDGDYAEIWGYVGEIPYLSKLVSKLFPLGGK